MFQPDGVFSLVDGVRGWQLGFFFLAITFLVHRVGGVKLWFLYTSSFSCTIHVEDFTSSIKTELGLT